MRKKLLKHSIVSVVMFIMLFCCGGIRAEAETPVSDITMVVGSSCYTYKEQKATTACRAEYVTFGRELKVIELGTEWAKIENGGTIRYMLSKNLEYCEKTVVKNRIMVSKGAYACSISSTLGYVYYGTDIQVLGEITSKKGVTYVHCMVPKTYEEDGKTLKNTNVEGYINKEYLTDKAIPKVVNGGTNLYENAYGASSPESMKKPVGYVYAGEEVRVMMSNKTWSKVLYGGKAYYMSTNKLDALQLKIMVNRAVQTVDAKPKSGYLHYVYWNTPITVLGTYESDAYGTYYYCKVNGDYGFVREYSSQGLQYVGYNDEMLTTATAIMYNKSSEESGEVMRIAPGTSVRTEYSNGTWVRVVCEGKTGYVLRSNLEYPVYNMNGKSYSTAYRLYKKESGKNVNEKVCLLAKNDKYGYAYVQNQEENTYWTETKYLKSAETGELYYTNMPSVTLHTQAVANSDSISIPYMTEVKSYGKISETNDGSWTKVSYDGKNWYIWMDAGVDVLTSQKSSYSYSFQTEYQEKVIHKALDIYKNWDTKYVNGQSNGIPDTDGRYGFDCSGFASYVLETVMQEYVPTYNLSANIVNLYNTEGIYNQGYNGEYSAMTVLEQSFDESKLQPGDVLFFNLSEEGSTKNSYNHCGIYLGNGEFIHSTHSWNNGDGGVIIMPLKGIYIEGFVAAKRYLPDTVIAANQTMHTNHTVNKVHEVKDSNSEPITNLTKGTEVTLLFTDNGNWAYVEYEKGKYGYILRKRLE